MKMAINETSNVDTGTEGVKALPKSIAVKLEDDCVLDRFVTIPISMSKVIFERLRAISL